MKEQNVVVYISEADKSCQKVVELMERYEVDYELKNVTKHREYMKELQSIGVFGTPALFVNSSQPIQGYQEGRILHALGRMPN